MSQPSTPIPENFKKKLEGEIDGIWFAKQKRTGNIDFMYLTLDKPEEMDFNSDVGSYKWLILLYEKTPDPDVFQFVYYTAYLGDVKRFVNNQIKAGSEGLLVKKSGSGFNIFFKLLAHLPLSEIHDRFVLDVKKFFGVN